MILLAFVTFDLRLRRSDCEKILFTSLCCIVSLILREFDCHVYSRVGILIGHDVSRVGNFGMVAIWEHMVAIWEQYHLSQHITQQ